MWNTKLQLFVSKKRNRQKQFGMDLHNREGLSSAFREEIVEVYNQGFCANKNMYQTVI